MFKHKRKVHVACNLNHLFENEGLLKVTASHVPCKCEWCQIVVVTTDH